MNPIWIPIGFAVFVVLALLWVLYRLHKEVNALEKDNDK